LRVKDCYLCFTPPTDSIDVGQPPALRSGGVTFGSFNNLAKVNDAVVAVWARVLGAVPQSRLFLKSEQFQEPSIRGAMAARFARHGIDVARLQFEPLVPRADYLKPFQRVDIALDPFPYPGITTTVENLWMGVPVLTMSGTTFQSRQGVSLLMNAGLPQWIATDADDDVRRAEAQAKDLFGLAALRAGLRERVAASAMFDSSRFAVNFGSALREMWTRWCKEAKPGG
jgi:predicted O-linked N-acetylglucosamine transferase (SPINDLY family)